MENHPLLRSVLYVPALNQRAIEKVRSIDVDVIVFDLEDSVAPDSKQQARHNLLECFSSGHFGDSATVIRTNTIGGADYLEDLHVISQCNPGAVLLPKVSTVADVEAFERDAVENGLKETLHCWFMIETVASIVNLQDIAAAGQQCRYSLQALVIGHNDLSLESGVSYTGNRQFFLPWLMQILLHAKHCDLAVVDSVWNHFKDLDGFRTETLQAKEMGFSGKSLIHPSQVDITNQIFTPDAAQIAEAKLIIAAYQQPENVNAGVINLQGRMVERLHLQQAYNLLEKYRIDI